MAVRLIPCRHRDTGAETEIAETALGYFPDYQRLDQEPGEGKAADDERQPDPEPGGEQPPGTDRESKPATGAAKKK